MGTSFNDIFEQFYLIIDDKRLIDNYTTDNLLVLLSQYVDRARGIFRDYCYKDLDDYTATTRTTYNFTGDGTTVNFVLSPTPPTSPEFYISVDDTEVDEDNYTFTSATNTITMSSTPITGSDIYVAAYVVGSFTDTLNMTEIELMARAMTIPWLEFMVNKKKHLDQIVYGKDMIVHSQANHNKSNKEILKETKESLKQDMFYYTYKENDDELDGLSGANY